jgi:hypothetical protein
MKMKKKIFSVVLALLMVLVSCTTAFAVDTEQSGDFDGYVYFTVERNTLGQGFALEPVKVGYYQGETLADISQRALGDMSTYEGDLSNYYLTGVIDGGEPENWSVENIPTDILNALDGADNIGTRESSDTLSAYDYSGWSGWMFTVDNIGINVGAGGIELGDDTSDGLHYKDGSVVRLQYTVYGYGEDVGIFWGTPTIQTTNTFCDRSDLIKMVADINAEGNADAYGEAYTDALELLNTWNITEEEVNSAVDALEKAKPYDGYIYLTVERNTLGQGLAVEPVKVGYYKGESLAEIAERAFNGNTVYSGTPTSNYYLTGIKDGGEPDNWTVEDVPKDILNALGGEDYIEERTDDDVLSSEDYTAYSGWMFTIDNVSGNDYASSIVLGDDTSTGFCYADNSVVRFQYTAYGWGEDIGCGWGYMPFETTNTFCDRSDLIKMVADINAEGNVDAYGEAYTNALELLNTWNITEEEVNSAVDALDNYALKETHNAEWSGAMNYSPVGNTVTDRNIVLNNPEEKWSYALNTTKGSWGTYYAGQTVIVDNYIYATGAGKLHKINTKTGEGETVADSGSTAFYYDYLCYGGNTIFVSTTSSIEAFDVDTLESLGKVSGSFGNYHPLQYYNGYLFCNGYIYKIKKNAENIFTQVGDSKIDSATFGWTQGVFLNDYYYVTSSDKIFCVDYKTGEVLDSLTILTNNSVTGQLTYDEDNNYLYWASYGSNNIQAVSLDDEGKFDADSYITANINQKSVCAPVVYNNRIYVAGQSGKITVINGDPNSDSFLSVIYETQGVGKIQSNPILTTAYENTTGNVYIYVQSYTKPGNIYYLEDNQNKTEGTLEQLTNLSTTSTAAYAYEQIAVDDEGSIYFYNEEGYLYCWGQEKSHTYSYTANLDGTHTKYCTDEECNAEETEECTFENGACQYCDCKVETGIYGDVNGDGEVNTTDATLIQKAIVKLVNLTDSEKFFATIDNMELNVKVVTKLQKYIADVEMETQIGTNASRYYN